MANNTGTLVTSPIRPFSQEDTFPSAYANELLGGYKTVTTIAERDAIPLDRLTVGMLVNVDENNTIYQWDGEFYTQMIKSSSMEDLSLLKWNNISAWGDSLTQGTGGTPYSTVLTTKLRGYSIYNGGIGGETSTQIKNRMLSATSKWDDCTIIWVGRNNYSDATTIKSDIAQMVSSLGHNKYLILGVINGNYGGYERIGGEGYNQITSLNQDLKTIYGVHYFDIRKYLINRHGDTTQDNQDFLDDIVPSSLRSDNIHLNTVGYQIVAQGILENLHVLIGVNNTVLTIKDANNLFATPPEIGKYAPNRGTFSRINIGTTASQQGLNIADGYNVAIEGGYIFFTGGTNGIYFGGNGGISGISGRIDITASGTNQNITLTPSGTGGVIAPTPSTSDNSTKVATTAFVNAQSYAKLGASQSGSFLLTGNVFLQGYDNRIYFPGNASITGNAGNIQLLPNGKTVIIGSSVEETSSMLTVTSTTKGFLPPRMTTTQINAITSPAIGLTVYNTVIDSLCFYNSSGWQRVSYVTM